MSRTKFGSMIKYISPFFHPCLYSGSYYSRLIIFQVFTHFIIRNKNKITPSMRRYVCSRLTTYVHTYEVMKFSYLFFVWLFEIYCILLQLRGAPFYLFSSQCNVQEITSAPQDIYKFQFLERLEP